MGNWKWWALPLALGLALAGCAQPTAATYVVGTAAATAQLDQYQRDAQATLDTRDLERQALAARIEQTAVAGTATVEAGRAQATATVGAEQTRTALTFAMTADAATAAAQMRAAQATRVTAAEATAASVTATRQTLEVAQAEAEARRKGYVSAATLVIVVLLVVLATSLFGWLLWKLIPTLVNRAGVVRYGQHGNPLLLSERGGRMVVTDPLRMLQASMSIDERGRQEMPRLTPDHLQLVVTGGVLTTLIEQARHAPGHPAQLPAEVIQSRRLGPVQTETTTRYAPGEPPRVTEVPAPIVMPDLLPAGSQVPARSLLLEATRHGRVLLGMEGGQAVQVPPGQLCHVGIAGATGAGKSSVMRLLLAQLLVLGAQVVLADPHYTDLDPKSGDDWRPIRRRLMMAPVYEYEEIGALLTWLEGELERRLALRREAHSGNLPWTGALFVAFDEYPLIAANVPEAAARLGRVLREGRKVDVLAVGAMQDMLVRTIGGDGAVRENYRTGYYLGGDATTARVLLDVRGRIEDGGLGQGAALLRSVATTPARQVTVPLVSNEDLYALLPAPSPYPEGGNGSGFDDAGRGEGTGPGSEEEADVEEEQIVQLLRAGKSMSEVIRELFGASGGRRYREAAARVGEVITRRIR